MKNPEDEWANYYAEIREILSSVQILQSAVQNLHNPPELQDIDNSLEIIHKKLEASIGKIDFIKEYYLNN